MTPQEATTVFAQIVSVLYEKGTYTPTPKDFNTIQEALKVLQDATKETKKEAVKK